MSLLKFGLSAATRSVGVGADEYERRDPRDACRRYRFSIASVAVNQHYPGQVRGRLGPGRPRGSGVPRG